MDFNSFLEEVEKGNLEAVKEFVSQGVDVTAQDNEAIMYASYKGHLDILKYLVSQGADVTAQDNRAIFIATWWETALKL
jgi:ankyrin repeat protein